MPIGAAASRKPPHQDASFLKFRPFLAGPECAPRLRGLPESRQRFSVGGLSRTPTGALPRRAVLEPLRRPTDDGHWPQRRDTRRAGPCAPVRRRRQPAAPDGQGERGEHGVRVGLPPRGCRRPGQARRTRRRTWSAPRAGGDEDRAPQVRCKQPVRRAWATADAAGGRKSLHGLHGLRGLHPLIAFHLPGCVLQTCNDLGRVDRACRRFTLKNSPGSGKGCRLGWPGLRRLRRAHPSSRSLARGAIWGDPCHGARERASGDVAIERRR